jgi:catechol 2,3-dioxygenase
MATEPQTSARAARIHPDTRIGSVHVTVRDLSRSRDFYERVLGLRVSERDSGSLASGAAGGRALIELHGDPNAPPLDPRATGLFHQALLMPTRWDLALALGRLAQARWPLSGASDHLVSEALYLSDPDGNGIEIYRDRPREEWRYSDGQLQMATLPLDLRGVLGQLATDGDPQPQAPPGTRMGHIHLQVSDLREADAFYNGVLEFEVTVRGYPGALFLSAGGYHHHIGLNIWNSAGASPPPAGSIGLRSFDVVLPTPHELERVVGRAREAGLTIDDGDGGPLVRDPSGNGVRLISV